MKSQIIRHDIKANLEIALEYSHTGLKADDQGDYEAAVTAYQKVILTLTDVLFDYNKDIRKTNSLDSKKKRRLIKEKRDKYINRLNVLWESIPYHCKVSLSTLLCRPGQTSANRTHHFVDYQTSLTNVLQIDSRKEVIPVYSSDSYISTFEKLGRISQTIRHGSYVDDSLFVPPDVWSCGWQKIDSIEIKQTAIQLLTTPLAKLTSIQQSDAHLSNLLKFKQALSEFLNSQEQAANFLVNGFRLIVDQE
ncbi:hypothetical protein BC833DRAFT_590058 [Globomyces pollinis-pini]|nr:hypothetical protein BC833DRAFT_590058 [Globomyces pollinis-pini]